MNNDMLIKYLINLIEKCEKYEAFLIPGAIGVDGQLIQLHDVYTKLKVVTRKEYEEAKRQDLGFESERDSSYILKGKGEQSSKFDIKSFLDGLVISQEKEKETKTGLLEKLLSLDNELQEAGNTKKIGTKETDYVRNTNENNQHEITSSAKSSFPTEVILSAPGGGKSTLLKMYAIAFSYRFLNTITPDILNDIFSEDTINKFKNISDELEIKEGAVPIFIEVRDIKTMKAFPDFASIMQMTINSLMDGECYDTRQIFSSEYKTVIIVDSIDEFINEESKNSFLQYLEKYEAENESDIARVIISSRYQEYQEYQLDFKDVLSERRIEEKVISELFNDFDIITEFAEKWYKSLEKIHGIKIDVQRDFIEPIKSNPNARALITNPLELTSMLLISGSDNFLPQDISKMYGRSIELWITWTNAQGFNYNYEDVMSQLAHIAFRMAVSEHDRITIRDSGLNQIIKDSRRDLQRYFKQEWSPEEDLDEFKLFLRKSHIFDYSGNVYAFVHRQYQAYLVAYCIKNNLFSRETRKRSRYDYIGEHIKEKDDFWTQIIILISMLDIDLRDEIIENLLDYAAEEIESCLLKGKGKRIKDYSLYFLSMLLQLAIVPGINFDSYEFDKLYLLMMDNEAGWELIERHKADITKLLMLNNQKENDLFLQKAIKKYKELKTDKKDIFRDSFATIIFYCLWNCDVSEKILYETCKLLFRNFLNTNIVREIYNSRNVHDITDRRMYKVLCELGEEAINDEQNPISDYYLLIATMKGYADSGESPYDVAYELCQSGKLEERIIAINILIIASWLLKIKRERSLGYGFELCNEKEPVFCEFINSGIMNDNEKEFCRDYYSAYIDFYSSECADDFSKALQEKATFITCVNRIFDRVENSKTLWDSESGDFCREIEYISTYPIDSYGSVFELEKRNRPTLLERFISEVTLGINNSTDSRNKVIGLKMLALFYSQKAEGDAYFDELERIISESKRELKEADLEYWAKKMSKRPISISGMEDINELFKELGLFASDVPVSNRRSTLESNEDFYSKQEYEKAKAKFLMHFESVENRNNLAYMLRRKEISSVYHDGKKYDVPNLLQDGVELGEPYSLINYALYISEKEGVFYYNKGLEFLKNNVKNVSLLDAAMWWYDLKKKGELEGYIVSMWLCDLNLSIFDSKDELLKKCNVLFRNKIVYIEGTQYGKDRT